MGVEPRVLLSTTAIGSQYRRWYRQLFEPSHRWFASNRNWDFVVIDRFLDKAWQSVEHIPLQKLLLADEPEVSKYDWVVHIDADVFANWRLNINLPEMSESRVGGVNEWNQPTREARAAWNLEWNWPKTPTDYY